MKIRLNYNGGNAEGRMIKDKERSLKKALLYSYQAATAILEDGREFKCLINPNKNKPEYDNKILSIPFFNNCLNKEEIESNPDIVIENMEEITIQGGDIIIWKETNTKWLVYLRYIEEDAYFRSEIRRCDYTVKIGTVEYPIYVRGPVETKIKENLKSETTWNIPNYTLTVMVTKNEDTLAFFHRFKQLKIDGKNWIVETVNDMDGDNVIEMTLSEYYNNEYETEEEIVEPTPVEPGTPLIIGEDKVYPYDIVTYTLENIDGGEWKVSYPKNPNVNVNKVVKIVESSNSAVTIEIVTGKSNTFVLSYDTEQTHLEKTITIASL